MRKLFFILSISYFAFLHASGDIFALGFQHYHSQEEIADYLRDLAQKHPDLVHFSVLGRSQQGREVALVVLTRSKNPEARAIYFNATHHGNEKASTEALLGLIDQLVQSRDEPELDRLFRRYRLILQPLVNPDGHALNARGDSQGSDPNRDYAGPSKPEKDAFRLVETRLVRQLLRRENVVASVAMHAGVEAVLWPWCHTPETSQDDNTFKSLGETVAHTMGLVRASQSFHDYKTDGEFIDYVYMKYGAYALTLEVATEPSPGEEQLSPIVNRAYLGSMSFLTAVDAMLSSKDFAGPVIDNASRTPSARTFF